jgi:drug/metabolite transporter (DMT)-like permease
MNDIEPKNSPEFDSQSLRMTAPAACLLLLLAALFWGVGNVPSKTVLDEIGPLTTASFRCSFTAILILPMLWLERGCLSSIAWWKSAFPVAVCFAAAITLQHVAFQTTTVTNASFLISTCTVLTPIFAWFYLQEPPSRTVIVAAILTVLGTAFMSGAWAGLSTVATGDIYCVLSAVFYSAWFVTLGKHSSKFGNPISITFLFCAVTAAIVSPFAYLIETPTISASLRASPEIAYLVVFSTVAAFGLSSIAQARVSASVAVILTSAESVFGAATASIFLGEDLVGTGLLGAGFIIAAILLVAASLRSSSSSGNRVWWSTAIVS